MDKGARTSKHLLTAVMYRGYECIGLWVGYTCSPHCQNVRGMVFGNAATTILGIWHSPRQH